MINTVENTVDGLNVYKDPAAPQTIDFYLDAINLVERAQRNLLEVVKDDFDRVGREDVNPVQALMLYHMGEDEMSAGDLRARGHYLGSNVSYNLKKLVELGYIDHKRCKTDKRAVRVKLTPQGLEIRNTVAALFTKQAAHITAVGELTHAELEAMNVGLQRLDRFWSDSIRFRL